MHFLQIQAVKISLDKSTYGSYEYNHRKTDPYKYKKSLTLKEMVEHEDEISFLK
jgi:hypothetical protein